MTTSKQTTDGMTYGKGSTDSLMTYTYNLGGALIEQQYPSGRVVKNVLDPNGDLAMVESKKNSSSGFWSYADSFTFNSAGAVTSMQLGNGKWESTIFNSRLQPEQIALGTVTNATDKLKLNYTYGTTNNNGNVLTQDITVTRSGQSPLVFNQTYTYDELNRLKSAEEKTGTTTNWKQVYSFDRYGNRNFTTGTTFPTVLNSVTNPSFNVANNRINSSGYSFDLAGNVTADANGQSYVYDAENKQTSASNGSGTLGQYYFDGDGKRVKKVVSSSGETTIFVYDASGKLVAEYSTNVIPAQDAKVQYLTNDNLGTPRINTDRDGNVTSRTDYMPFGEEIIGLGNRVSADKYVVDDVRQGYTGYINDGETGLDFAQARMYANRLGRFTGVDFGSFTPADPQNWNRYVFTLNNPLKFIDPTGKDIELTGSEAQSFVDYLEKNSGLKLKYTVKNGVIKITGSTSDKNFKGKVNEKFRDVVKGAASAAEVAKFDVGRNNTNANGNDVLFDDNGDAWDSPRVNGELRTSKIDIGDITDADASAPEFAQAVVGHFLLEGIEMRKKGANYYNTGEPGAHELGLKTESAILSAATGSKQDIRYVPKEVTQTSTTFNFVYTTVQYDVSFKTNGIIVNKISPPNIQREQKKK